MACYPPTRLPAEDGTFRYARDVLGIDSAFAVKSIRAKVERAKDDASMRPNSDDFQKALVYLKGMGLSKTLIEMYDYLER